VCLVPLELAPHTYAHLRETLRFSCLLSIVLVTLTVNKITSLRKREEILWKDRSAFLDYPVYYSARRLMTVHTPHSTWSFFRGNLPLWRLILLVTYVAVDLSRSMSRYTNDLPPIVACYKRTPVVCSNREARKCPVWGHSRNGPWTWSHMHTHVSTQKRNRTKHTSINTEHGRRTHTRNRN